MKFEQLSTKEKITKLKKMHSDFHDLVYELKEIFPQAYQNDFSLMNFLNTEIRNLMLKFGEESYQTDEGL